MGVAGDEGDRRGRVRRPPGSSGLWRRIAALAAHQHGVVSVSQLLGLGVTSRRCWTWERADRLHRLHRGVYAVGFPPTDERAWWMAAVLACPDGAVVSHLAAGRLHGLVTWMPPVVAVTVVGSGVRSRRGIRAHRCTDLLATERTVVAGIPVTSAARALIDMAPTVSDGVLRRGVNQALVNRLTSEPALRRLIEHRSRRPGAATVRALLERTVVGTRSDLEDAALDLIDRHSSPGRGSTGASSPALGGRRSTSPRRRSGLPSNSTPRGTTTTSSRGPMTPPIPRRSVARSGRSYA